MRYKLSEIAAEQRCLECGAIIAPRNSRKQHEARKFCNSACFHRSIRGPRKTEADFWAKVDKTSSPHGCWLWIGANVKGYGFFKYLGENLAHRVAWRLAGRELSEDILLCHNCPGGDNPACIHPDHHFTGTHGDNSRDAVRKGRASWMVHPERVARGERHGSRTKPESRAKRLSTDEVREIRERYARGGVTHRTLAAEYGVTHRSIGLIVRRETWCWVD